MGKLTTLHKPPLGHYKPTRGYADFAEFTEVFPDRALPEPQKRLAYAAPVSSNARSG